MCGSFNFCSYAPPLWGTQRATYTPTHKGGWSGSGSLWCRLHDKEAPLIPAPPQLATTHHNSPQLTTTCCGELWRVVGELWWVCHNSPQNGYLDVVSCGDHNSPQLEPTTCHNSPQSIHILPQLATTHHNLSPQLATTHHNLSTTVPFVKEKE